MKPNGFRLSATSDQGGKSPYRKMLFISLIIAVMLASFPILRVLAAPPHDPPFPEDEDLEQAWEDLRSDLATEITFFSTFHPRPAQDVNPANQGLHLSMYRAAIYAAQALVINQTGFDDEGHVINEKRADQAIQELDDYLNRISGLKEKLRGSGNTVTTTSQSTTSADAAQILGLQQEWADKRSQFSAEMLFFNNFRPKPGNDRNHGKYLDKYRAAIYAAQVIAARHDGFDASGQVVDAERASQTIQQLADALRMIRGLKGKLGVGGGDPE